MFFIKFAVNIFFYKNTKCKLLNTKKTTHENVLPIKKIPALKKYGDSEKQYCLLFDDNLLEILFTGFDDKFLFIKRHTFDNSRNISDFYIIN